MRGIFWKFSYWYFAKFQAHLEDPNPRRSLALSLHGFTGVGKNYATSILASNLFKKGERSRFYHFFDATVDFLFKDSVDLYKEKVLDLIANGVRSCGRSMFVFDEVHKMPAGILDAIVPLLGYAESINGVDYRKAIFVFMGNGGASVINEFAYKVLNSGKKRTSIQYGDLRRALAASVYNEKGAFEYSDLIKQHAITAVIPFLPLQEVHVRQCIGDAARRMAVEVNEEMEEFVLNELDWEPERSRIFSTSGCKLVYDKVGFYLQQSLFANEKGVIAQPSEHGEL
ncbi:unnamed protein product [Mesocestoides corti]|uniref:Torsin-1A C-terminal domain-containing protein n=1 Tax=Mesocestoides corti TaxID=53468 RepID=A0A3P6G9D4_MESCO|nr:unnamed protein product [Mesocestoides corti]